MRHGQMMFRRVAMELVELSWQARPERCNMSFHQAVVELVELRGLSAGEMWMELAVFGHTCSAL